MAEKVVILLRAQTGHDFSLYKKSTVYRRIERRMGIHQIGRIADYVRYLRENQQELDLLFGELLIGVSLLLGIFVRLGAIGGALQMLLFTVALWPIADTPTANPLVDNRVVLGLMFVMLYFLTAGRFLGLDGFLQRSKFVNRYPKLRNVVAMLG